MSSERTPRLAPRPVCVFGNQQASGLKINRIFVYTSSQKDGAAATNHPGPKCSFLDKCLLWLYGAAETQPVKICLTPFCLDAG